MARKTRRVLGARTYRNYSDATLTKALQMVNKGNSLRDVSRMFGIPTCTLSRKRRGLFNGKFGGQKALSDEEEKTLIDGIVLAGNWGFPLTTYDIKLIVKNYLDRKGAREKKFKNNTPGRRWIERFLKEHKDSITKRHCENIKRSRSEVSEQIIKEYFSELEKSMEGVLPSHVINYDETNFTDDPGRVQVIVKRGTKHPERCIDSSKSSVSVMMAGTAAGFVLPPYIVYKSEHLYTTWTEHGPKGCRYNRTKSGWFDTTIFEDWFQTIIIPFVKDLDDGPKVLIGDNLSSHLSLLVISECQKYNIRFVLLPANSTHLCQPLDVSFFRPLKGAWRKQLLDWKIKNKGVIPKDRFPSLLKCTLDSIEYSSTTNLINGFKACGISPFDPNQVLKRLPDWSKTPSTEDSTNQHMSVSIIEVLEKFRYPNEKKMKKKKRMPVTPGKSVTGNEDIENIENIDPTENETQSASQVFQEYYDAENNIRIETEKTDNTKTDNTKTHNTKTKLPKTKTIKGNTKTLKRTKRKKIEFEESESEGSVYSLRDSSSDYETLSDLIRAEREKDDSVSPTSSEYLVGDFLVVEFTCEGKKSKASSYYIGEIIEVIETDADPQFYCKFMKKMTGPKALPNTFVYPEVDDLSIIDKSQVIQKLDSPAVSRGHHTFSMNENEYQFK